MDLFITLMGGGGVPSSTQGAGGATSGGGTSGLVMMILLMLVMFLVLIIPQRRKDKKQKSMLAAIKKGDKIVTIGGIHGTVSSVKENTVIIKVENDARIEFTKSAIAEVLNARPQSSSSNQKGQQGKNEVAVDITPVRKGEEKKAEEGKSAVEESAEEKK